MKPGTLRPGDTITVVAPASAPFSPDHLERGIAYLEAAWLPGRRRASGLGTRRLPCRFGRGPAAPLERGPPTSGRKGDFLRARRLRLAPPSAQGRLRRRPPPPQARRRLQRCYRIASSALRQGRPLRPLRADGGCRVGRDGRGERAAVLGPDGGRDAAAALGAGRRSASARSARHRRGRPARRQPYAAHPAYRHAVPARPQRGAYCFSKRSAKRRTASMDCWRISSSRASWIASAASSSAASPRPPPNPDVPVCRLATSSITTRAPFPARWPKGSSTATFR